jgi:hypothetical protein
MSLVPIYKAQRIIHSHPMHLVAADTALAVTAMVSTTDTRKHLQRLLTNTRLKGIAWINLPLEEMSFEFLERQSYGG